MTLSGLAWTPGSEAVCFGSYAGISCADIDKPHVRQVAGGPQRFALYDIASDGRMLAATLSGYQGLMAGDVGGREVDLSWQDIAYPIDFSPDGNRLLFGSLGYGIHLRALDGSPPVMLAEGIPGGISPDGRFVLMIAPGVPTTIGVVPTGAGATRTLPRGKLESHYWVAWMPDGRHVVIAATERGHATRLYLQDIMGGEPRAISDEGVGLLPSQPRLVSPDGQLVIAVGPDQQPGLYPVAGGKPRPIPALGRDLIPLGWGESSQVLFARGRVLSRLVAVFKIDLASGRRHSLREVGPSDAIGAPVVFLVQVSRDGKRYAYSTWRSNGALFLIEGVKP